MSLKEEDREVQGERHVRVKAETREMRQERRMASKSPEEGRPGIDFSLKPSEATNHANTLILGFWCPDQYLIGV